jgi:hypothetical protein
MPWQVVILMLVITAFVTIGYCVSEAAEASKAKSTVDITTFRMSDLWDFMRGVGGILGALAVLAFGLTLVDLTTHNNTLGKISPTIKVERLGR